MAGREDDVPAYFSAVRALRSDDPWLRRPAISTLLELCRYSKGPVGAAAERALVREFGAYVISDGLSGCAGSAETVYACAGDCHACVWLWREPPRADGGVAVATQGRAPQAIPANRDGG